MRTRIALIIASLVLLGCEQTKPTESTTERASAERLEADLRFLADDLLEGREAGTRGFDIAALFVAERFRALGLEPGGDDGTFFQAVPMLEYGSAGEGEVNIGDINLVKGEDYLILPSSKGEIVDLSAPVVFGGMCFASERENRDDFAGLDLDGKIIACMRAAPKYLNSEELAHYRSTQFEVPSEKGAVAGLSIYTQSFESVLPFASLNEMITAGFSNMTWLDEAGTPYSATPNIKARVYLSLDGAEKVFANAGKSFDDILAVAESDAGDVDGFELGIDMTVHGESRHEALSSDNVVGILPGSDPELANEYIILTGHLDHEGVKPTEEEGDDEIFNGAMDNASGISALLEVARLLKASPPRRSIIFIALTAEEKGLTGSDYFARNPTVPANSMVATVNLDMPLVTYEFTDIIAFGAERSTLEEPVKKAVEAHDLVFSPDPIPQEGLFTRSDHYSFVLQGVPAVYLKPGFANGGEEARAEFSKTHYHKASDEVHLVNFDALRRFTDVKADISRNIADMPERPVWNAGDFFGTTFGGPIASE